LDRFSEIVVEVSRTRSVCGAFTDLELDQELACGFLAFGEYK
jgi:hypothetical protein